MIKEESIRNYVEDLQHKYINRYSVQNSYYCVNKYFYSAEIKGRKIDGAYSVRSGSCQIDDIIQKSQQEILEFNRWYSVKSGTTLGKSLVFISPIYLAGNESRLIGYVGAAIDLDYLKNTLLLSKNGKYEESFLIDIKDKKVLVSGKSYDNETLNDFPLPQSCYETALKEHAIFVKNGNVYSICKVNDNILFMRSNKVLLLRAKTNVILFITYIFSLIAVFAFKTHKGQQNMLYAINKLSNKAAVALKISNSLKVKSLVLVISALIATFVVHAIFAFIAGKSIYYVLAVFILLTAWGASLYLFVFGKISYKLKITIIAAAAALLFIFFVFSGNVYLTIYGFLISVLLYIGMCIYIFNEKEFGVLYLFSIAATAVMLLLNVFINGNDISEVNFLYVTLTYIFIIVMFTMHNLLIKDNENHEKETEALLNKLQDTQEIIIANERMTTLGHIVASVAHEINTPIGAIKASADTFSTSLIPFLESFNTKLEKLDEEEMAIVFDLLELSFESVKKLLSTTEIRNAKKQIKELLEENGIENAFYISNKLARLEICDLNEIKARLDEFRAERIEYILNIACDVFFLITGINTTVIASNKVSKIVYALKSYSNMTTFSMDKNMEEFNIIETIDNIITLYSSQFTDKISIVKEYDRSVASIIGNSEAIGQVCVNIIQNALYAMKDTGGILTISTKKVGNLLYLEFSDTGCGIAPEDIGKIFDPLFTTKPLGEGSGLGLGICKKIIEGHNGTINVTSILNEGTSFFITLPINQMQIQKEE